MLERLEIILNKSFKTEVNECVEGYSAEEMEDSFYMGAQEVKDYLRDTLQLYCYEKGVQDDR
jgi:hypothetical protein